MKMKDGGKNYPFLSKLQKLISRESLIIEL